MKTYASITLCGVVGFALGVLGTSLTAEAGTQSITIPNFSFEAPGATSDNIHNTYGASTSTFFQDWTVTQENDSAIGTLNYNSDTTLTGGTDLQGAYIGTWYEYYVITLTSGNSANNDGSTAGNTGYVTTVIPSTTYTMTVSVGVPSNQLPPSGSDAPGVVLSLIDSDGNTFASRTIPYAELSQGTMTDEVMTFTSSASPSDNGEGLKVQIQIENGYNTDSQGPAVFDNVRLVESGANIPNTVQMTVPNFSFENPASSSDDLHNTWGFNTTTNYIRDWTVLQENNSTMGTMNYAADSTITGGTGLRGAYLDTWYEYYVITMTSGNSSNNDGSTAGSTGYVATVLPSTTYNLTVAVGVPSNELPPSGSDAPGVVLSLVDSDGNTFASRTIPYADLPQGSMTDETMSFISSASPSDSGEGLKIQIQIENGYNTDSQGGAAFDNVRLSETGLNVVNPDQPYVFHSNKSAGPGDVFEIQGDNFGADPEVWMEHVTGSETSLSPQTKLRVVNAGNTSVTAQIPTTETLGLYAVWVINNGVSAGPIFVNKAQSWGAVDLAGTAIDPGRSFRLFGRNLCLAGATPTVSFVNGSTSIPATVTTMGSDSYSLHVTAPSSLSTSTVYTVVVSNGFGGTYGQAAMTYTLTGRAGGTDVFGLGVPWGTDPIWATINSNVYNVKTDSRLSVHAVGDGVTDDTNAIQYAIWTASGAGGGTVYIPAGTYYITQADPNGWCPINMASNVVLKGDGMTATQLKISNCGSGNGYAYQAWQCDHVGFLNLGFYDTVTGKGENMEVGSSTDTFAVGCQFIADAGKNAGWNYCTSTVFKNCSIISGNNNGGEPLWFLGNLDTVFTNNTVQYYWARVRSITSVRTLLENNTVTRIPDNSHGPWESGGFDMSCDQQLALINNTINKGGSGNFTENNDGETILTQGDGTPGKVVSTVTGSTATTLTDSTQSWAANFFTDHSYGTALSNLPNQGYYLAIVSGQGAGQIREIVSNTGNTLTLDHPWTEQPGVGSYYTINYLEDHDVLVKNNNLSHNRQGIELFQVMLLGVDIVGNTLYDNGGIAFYAFATGTVDDPNYPTFNTIMDSAVIGNSVTTDSSNPYLGGDSYAQVSMSTLVPETGPGLGTAVYGWEVRNNSVSGWFPPSGWWEGYWIESNYGGGEIDKTATDISNVGTVFEGNSSTSTNFGYLLGTGDVNTVIWNPTTTNVAQLVEDLPGWPYINASLDTTRSDLVAHWTLDESIGSTSFDSSGFGDDGTWQNGPSFTSDHPSAIAMPDAGSLTFNGSGQSVFMGNPANLPSGYAPRTICGWGKAANTSGGWRWIAAYGSPSGSQAMFIGMNGTTLDGGAYGDDLEVPNFWDSNWHFIALTYDGTTAKLYADGSLVASSTRNWNLVPYECYIGEQVNNANEYWQGSIDDVRIYNRALSATEISSLSQGN
jgi:hypothetical protein